MMARLLMLTCCAGLSACADDRGFTQVVNSSERPVTISFTDHDDSRMRRVAVRPGETKALAPDRALADLDDIAVVTAEQRFTFRDWPATRSRFACRRDCRIEWTERNGVAVHGPFVDRS